MSVLVEVVAQCYLKDTAFHMGFRGVLSQGGIRLAEIRAFGRAKLNTLGLPSH